MIISIKEWDALNKTKTKSKRKHTEHEQQAMLFAWAKASGITELKWMHASMNACKRTIIQQNIAKAAGLKAGVSDIFLPKKSGNYCGLYIEMKIKPNKPTKEQQQFINDMNFEGYLACICYSFLEAKNIIINYLKNLPNK